MGSCVSIARYTQVRKKKWRWRYLYEQRNGSRRCAVLLYVYNPRLVEIFIGRSSTVIAITLNILIMNLSNYIYAVLAKRMKNTATFSSAQKSNILVRKNAKSLWGSEFRSGRMQASFSSVIFIRTIFFQLKFWRNHKLLLISWMTIRQKNFQNNLQRPEEAQKWVDKRKTKLNWSPPKLGSPNLASTIFQNRVIFSSRKKSNRIASNFGQDIAYTFLFLYINDICVYICIYGNGRNGTLT